MSTTKISMKTKLFFDLDQTLARSRIMMADEMRDLLISHGDVYEYVVISGAEYTRIKWQINGVPMHILGNVGNDAHDQNGDVLWQNPLTEEQKQEVREHAHKLIEFFNIPDLNEDDLIEDRLYQMCYSTLGHNADLDAKHAFDPSGEKRKAALQTHPFSSETIEVLIGGTTTFDYFQRGMHKGKNIVRFLAHKGWPKEECVYFGDRLHPGGNDESVIGVIETVSVENPDDTYQKLTSLFGARN